MLLDKNTDKKELLDDKYEWERDTLRVKFLIQHDFDEIFIPDEIISNVEEAVKKVKWSAAKKKDELNEMLVGYCKIQASAILITVCNIVAFITGENKEALWNHMMDNRLFRYYVLIYSRDFESFGKDIPIVLYQDYYSIEEELDEQRSIQGLSTPFTPDVKMLKTLFYNDFDINNKKIKKMLEEIKKLPFFWDDALNLIREYAVLNIDRTSLKKSISSVPSLEKIDLTKFFKVLDEAMDEMPSGALNGHTPNQAKEANAQDEIIKYNSEKKYEKQQNACLSKEDAKLFYKIYFALLEFTNNKYKIKKNLRIYNKIHLNPNELADIIERFWKNKNTIVSEFCKSNPYRFNKEELNITSEFKKGFRDICVIAAFEKEYTAVISKDKIYMIKGLNDNIDNVISYKNLPTPVMTSIIPFKNVLTYDGIFMEFAISLGNGFKKLVEEDYAKSIKYYHL